MRNRHKMAVLTAMVGGLSVISTGMGFAAAPAPAPQGQASVQPDAPQQGPVQQGSTQAAPQQNAPQGPQADPQSTQIAPQVAPQLSPQVSPTVNLPQALPMTSQPAADRPDNVFHPEQECSPQTVLQANLPISVLGGESETKGDTCTQVNNAFRS